MAMIRNGWSIANPLVGTLLLSACLLACDSNDSSNPSSGAAIEDASRRDVMMPQAMDAFVLGDAGPEPVQDAGNGPRPDGMVCGTVSARALGAKRPVDIVWAIDSSPSMDDEIETIQANLNTFALNIGDSNLDYRVILIGSDRDLSGGVDIPELHDHIGICVPPPLSGAPGCPDTDSERYLHVRSPIHSDDALAVTMSTFGQWQTFLRDDARMHLIFVSDDDHASAVDRAELLQLGKAVDLRPRIIAKVTKRSGCWLILSITVGQVREFASCTRGRVSEVSLLTTVL